MNELNLNEMTAFLAGSKEDFDLERVIDYYFENKKHYLMSLNKRNAARILISMYNFEQRNKLKSSELLGYKVKIGDICYVDFGQAYLNEAGYQHFALVVGYCNSKALVVPMSSNNIMYKQSFCSKKYTNGKKHLYRLPEVQGLYKKSVLFLNDIKYINTSRIIAIKSHIDPKTNLFKDILARIWILV